MQPASSVRSSANAETSARSATGAMRFFALWNSPAAKSNRSPSRLIGGARHLDAAALAGADRVEELLAAHRRARVPEDDGRAVLRRGEIRQRLGEEGVGALLDSRDAHESRLAEERRRGDRQQGALRVVVGPDVRDLETRVLGAKILAHCRGRPLGADLFRTRDEHDRRRLRIAP